VKIDIHKNEQKSSLHFFFSPLYQETQNFLFHVHTAADIMRKMTLSSCTESVDKLKEIIKKEVKLDFTLSYEDPAFDGQLCSLVDIEELPQKAVLKKSYTI